MEVGFRSAEDEITKLFDLFSLIWKQITDNRGYLLSVNYFYLISGKKRVENNLGL